MVKRLPLKQSLRFEVFTRDGFKCKYCGKTPADGVTLHCDHVIPVAEGGQNEIENLVTACFDCNIGKGKKLITRKIKERDIKSELKEMKEKEKVMLEYYKYLKQRGSIEENMRGYRAIEESINFKVSDHMKKQVDKRVKEFGVDIVSETLRDYSDKGTNYIAGILHNKFREKQNPVAYKIFTNIVWKLTDMLRNAGHQYPIEPSIRSLIWKECKFADENGYAMMGFVDECDTMLQRLLDLAEQRGISVYKAIQAFLKILKDPYDPLFFFSCPNHVVLDYALTNGISPFGLLEDGSGLEITKFAIDLEGYNKPTDFDDGSKWGVYEKNGKYYLERDFR